ncbi:hypothetical protein CDIK_0462 [Cucumispora dikerogammari]|nr:hypothetical protein CDIK_0462 [Cucumispora dikerogammari]
MNETNINTETTDANTGETVKSLKNISETDINITKTDFSITDDETNLETNPLEKLISEDFSLSSEEDLLILQYFIQETALSLLASPTHLNFRTTSYNRHYDGKGFIDYNKKILIRNTNQLVCSLNEMLLIANQLEIFQKRASHVPNHAQDYKQTRNDRSTCVCVENESVLCETNHGYRRTRDLDVSADFSLSHTLSEPSCSQSRPSYSTQSITQASSNTSLIMKFTANAFDIQFTFSPCKTILQNLTQYLPTINHPTFTSLFLKTQHTFSDQEKQLITNYIQTYSPVPYRFFPKTTDSIPINRNTLGCFLKSKDFRRLIAYPTIIY